MITIINWRKRGLLIITSYILKDAELSSSGKKRRTVKIIYINGESL